jgi:hypothetical protein
MYSPSNSISPRSFSSSNYVKVLSPIDILDPPPFLDPIFFVDHIVAPYPHGPSSIGFFVVTSLDLGASFFASLHVQNSQEH